MKKTVAVFLFLVLSCVAQAKGQKVNPQSRGANLPKTFDFLDRRLAALARQQQELKVAISPPQNTTTTIKPRSRARRWTQSAVNIRKIAESIRIAATAQERQYKSRKQSYGVRAFAALADRAAAVEQSAQLLQKTLEDTDAAKQKPMLDQRALNLVLQYQAINGGFANAHCSGKSRLCCEPKQGADDGGDRVVACKWTCSASVGSCSKGFTD